MGELPPLPEPVAWQWLNGGHFRKYLPTSAERDAWTPLFSEAQIREYVAAVAAAKSAKKSANPPDAYAVYVRDEMMNRPFCTYEEAVEWARKNIANGSNQPHHIRTLHAATAPLADVPGWLRVLDSQ